MPRPYPPEFRQRALDLVRSGRSVPEVAGLLGIAQSCLYRWKQQDLIDRGSRPRRDGPSPRSSWRHGRGSVTLRRRTRSSAGQRPRSRRWCPQKSGSASWTSSAVTGSASARLVKRQFTADGPNRLWVTCYRALRCLPGRTLTCKPGPAFRTQHGPILTSQRSTWEAP
jgi:transposase-like protein